MCAFICKRVLGLVQSVDTSQTLENIEMRLFFFEQKQVIKMNVMSDLLSSTLEHATLTATADVPRTRVLINYKCRLVLGTEQFSRSVLLARCSVCAYKRGTLKRKIG